MALETNGKEENVIQQCWSASEEHFFAPGKPQNGITTLRHMRAL